MLKEVHLGIDDTDSHDGMCTTYLATLIVDLLIKYSVRFLDFPKLIRLNPNIPYKTRGNGAISISFITTTENINEIWNQSKELVMKYSDIASENTDPGFVMLIGKPTDSLRELYKNALYQVITIDFVKELLSSNFSGKFFYLKKGRGLIGACAAIGADICDDYTYEFIAYRSAAKTSSERLIDIESVIIADKSIPLSFNNYDYDNNELMITPHGPDPVYVGIRGDTSHSVLQMWKQIKINEEITSVMLFRSNQHTQPHFPEEISGKALNPYTSVKLRGFVEKEPYVITGGHVLFTLMSDGEKINCAAYEPTKKFRKIVRELKKGDELLVFGGVRPPSEKYEITINLEQLIILRFRHQLQRITLKCPYCLTALKSQGKNQGLVCKKCDFTNIEKDLIFQTEKRRLRTNIRYLIPVCAQRHLTKPHSRENNMKSHLSSEIEFGEAFAMFLSERAHLINHPYL
jgi:tRNA(Ile2)-agmatinylcytidine synthase